mgnify:CR=1 FL=1
MFQRHSRLTGEIVHYYSGDPAFDTETRRADVPPPPDAPADWQPPPVFDFARWLETGDETCLPRKPGAAPVKIVCKRLSPEERALLEDIAAARGQNQALLWLVRLSVQRLEPHPPDTPKLTRVSRDGFFLLADDWAELIRLHDDGALYFELSARLLKEMTPSARS